MKKVAIFVWACMALAILAVAIPLLIGSRAPHEPKWKLDERAAAREGWERAAFDNLRRETELFYGSDRRPFGRVVGFDGQNVDVHLTPDRGGTVSPKSRKFLWDNCWVRSASAPALASQR